MGLLLRTAPYRPAWLRKPLKLTLYTSVAHDIGDHDNHKTLLYMPALYKLSKESP